MENKIIYIDLDGVIIDNSCKMYYIYKTFMQNNKKISKKEYWDLKRMKIPEEEIIKKTSDDQVFINIYLKKRIILIESEKYLKYDKLIGGAKETIKKLSKKNKIILITKRHNQNNLFKQLKMLNIFDIFDAILVSGKKSKEDIISQNNLSNKRNSIIIGDTEEDINAGKKIGIKTIAVLSGIRCEEYLKKYRPDMIIKDISKIFDCGIQ
jgi:phosphoglycolate phosphatase